MSFDTRKDSNHPYEPWDPPEPLDERGQMLSDLIDAVIHRRIDGHQAATFCRQMIGRT